MVGSQTKQPKPGLPALAVGAENPDVFPAALCSGDAPMCCLIFQQMQESRQCRATAPRQAEGDGPGPECCLFMVFCNLVSACEKPMQNSAQAALSEIDWIIFSCFTSYRPPNFGPFRISTGDCPIRATGLPPDQTSNPAVAACHLPCLTSTLRATLDRNFNFDDLSLNSQTHGAQHY